MSYTYIDSFKSYATSSDLGYRYVFTNGPQMMSLTTYNGEQTLQITGISHLGEMQYIFPSAYPYVNIQCEIMIIGIAATLDFIKFTNPTGTAMALGYNPFGDRRVRFDGNTSNTGTNFNTWLPVSVYATFGTPGTQATLWLDDNLATFNTTTGNINLADRVSFKGFNGANNNILVKNLVIRCRTSGEGDFPDKTIRKFKTDIMTVTSTRQAQFTPIDAATNHQAVGDLTPGYVVCTAATGGIDLYGYTKPTPNGAIKGLSVVTWSPNNTSPTALSGVISGASSIQYFPLPNTGLKPQFFTFETNPFGGTSWTNSDFNNIYVGVKK